MPVLEAVESLMGPNLPGVAGYIGALQAQWLLRLLDFLSTSMVIPTLAQYLESAGGEASDDYYMTLALTAAVQLVSNFVVGALVDRTGAVLALYAGTTLCSALGGALYAAADAVQELRVPCVIILARLLAGAGSGKTTLSFVFLGRTARAKERHGWVVLFATARSLGLFVGPPLAVAIAACAGVLRGVGPHPADHGGSIFGTFAVPGVFLCVTNVLGLAWLFAAWRPLPPRPPPTATPGSDGGGAHRGMADIWHFLSHLYVLAVMLAVILVGGSTTGIEYVVPITVGQVLGWGPSGSGGVLMAIAAVVVVNQMIVLSLSSWVRDYQMLTIGCFGLPATLFVALLLWALVLPVGPGAWWAARAHPWLVAAPFVLSECWCPYLGTGSTAAFTRLVSEQVPWRMGILQAAVTSNGPYLGQLVCTAWLSASYSSAQVAYEAAPRTSFLGIAVCNLGVFTTLLLSYKQLGTSFASDSCASTPMVLRAASLASFGEPSIIVPSEAIGVDDEPLLAGEQ